MRPTAYRFAALLLALTAAQASADDEADDFVARIEKAHAHEQWAEHAALAADIVVRSRDNEVLRGTLMFDTSASKSRIERDDGTVLVYDGQHFHISPADGDARLAWFHLLTWANYLALPHRLSNAEARIELVGDVVFDGNHRYPAGQLYDESADPRLFVDGSLIYRDPDTDRVAGAAYQARLRHARQPVYHAVRYHDYRQVDGVPIPMRWTFHPWRINHGLDEDDSFGSVVLDNVRFVEPASDAFAAPLNARTVDQPDQEE